MKGGAVVPVFEPHSCSCRCSIRRSPPTVEVGVVTALDADQFPLDRDGEPARSTPCSGGLGVRRRTRCWKNTADARRAPGSWSALDAVRLVLLHA